MARQAIGSGWITLSLEKKTWNLGLLSQALSNSCTKRRPYSGSNRHANFVFPNSFLRIPMRKGCDILASRYMRILSLWRRSCDIFRDTSQIPSMGGSPCTAPIVCQDPSTQSVIGGRQLPDGHSAPACGFPQLSGPVVSSRGCAIPGPQGPMH